MNIDAIFRNEANRKLLSGIYPIIDLNPEADIHAILDWAGHLPDVGVRLVQVRAKRFSDDVLTGILDEVIGELSGSGLTVVLNDYIELIGITGAHGVHLGLDDFPVFEARAMLGPDAIVGATCRNFADALLAAGQGASYIAAGSIYKSPTKQGAPVIGIDGLTEIVKHLDNEAPRRQGWGQRDNVPVCAIGGINKDNLKEVYESGASMVAVISAITGSDNPLESAKSLVDEWKQY